MEISLPKTSLHIWIILASSGKRFLLLVSATPLTRDGDSYLDNPELMSGASFLGLALISGSKLVGLLAVLRFFAHWWFLHSVET